MNIHTLVIIAANLLISLRGFRDYSFFEQYKFNVGALRNGENKRWISSGFLHVDWQHFIFNMFTLYIFASIVINQLGVYNFYLVYIVSLLSGNLFSFYFHKNESRYSAVGASGAVTGILYAAILLNPGMSLYLYFIPIPIPSYIVGVGYLLFSIYGMKTRLGNIGHDAHFGGAVGGFCLTLIVAPWVMENQLWVVLLLAAPIGLLMILKKNNKL